MIAVRIVNRMTIQQLAEYLGVSISTISAYENGRSVMPDNTTRKLRDLASRAPPRFKGQALVNIRTRISINKLAKLAGLSVRTIRNYRSNKTLPNIKFLSKMDKVMTFTEWEPGSLRKVQVKLGFNNREMAKLLGIHPSTWGRWVNGEMIPNIKRKLLRPLEGVLRCCKK